MMNLHTGLVSVTFRKLTASAVINMVKEAGLDGIEWGGDIHVPPEDLENAARVRRQTLDAGLKIAAYGSYYRLGANQASFGPILETALALEATTIRVWAGTVGSVNAGAAAWQGVISDGEKIADMAATAGVSISLEFHPDTLTDTPQSTLRLLRAIDRPNVFSYWQPPVGGTREANRQGLSDILP